MRGPAPHTAEEATRSELVRASLRLLLILGALALLVVPLIRELPLGQTTRTGILAWLLVVLAMYSMYAGLGYRPLLILQLLFFSCAVVLLSMKVLLVVVDVHRLSILRRVAIALILAGFACAGANLGAMLLALFRRWARREPA